MKKLLILLCFMISGCEFYVESDQYYSTCGYEETPYYSQPMICSEDPWTYEVCCTWIVDDFYSECAETWCHNENMCRWDLIDFSCYPI